MHRKTVCVIHNKQKKKEKKKVIFSFYNTFMDLREKPLPPSVASFFCSVFLFFFFVFFFNMLRVVSNVCFFMQRSYDVAGWMPIPFQKALFFFFLSFAGHIRGVEEKMAGIPPRVTRGSHFGANKAAHIHRKWGNKKKKTKNQVGRRAMAKRIKVLGNKSKKQDGGGEDGRTAAAIEERR